MQARLGYIGDAETNDTGAVNHNEGRIEVRCTNRTVTQALPECIYEGAFRTPPKLSTIAKASGQCPESIFCYQGVPHITRKSKDISMAYSNKDITIYAGAFAWASHMPRDHSTILIHISAWEFGGNLPRVICRVASQIRTRTTFLDT